MALWAFEQKVGWVMDGVDTVMTTRAPAVLIIHQKVTLFHDQQYFFSTLRLAMALSPDRRLIKQDNQNSDNILHLTPGILFR